MNDKKKEKRMKKELEDIRKEVEDKIEYYKTEIGDLQMKIDLLRDKKERLEVELYRAFEERDRMRAMGSNYLP